MDKPNGHPVAGVKTLEQCKAACQSVERYGCEAIIFNPTEKKCYRKRYINLRRCSDDPVLQLHVRTDPRPAELATPLIIDTDMSFDVDDVGAICMAHALHDLGEARLLAVVHDSGYPRGIGAASVLNHFYHHDNAVQLGAYKGPFGRCGADSEGAGSCFKGMPRPGNVWVTGDYVPDMVTNWQSPIKTSAQVEDAVTVYRRVLAAADDHSVVVAAIGFATNLEALLKSDSDEHSTLSGMDLVSRKIRLVVWQGGWYPERHHQEHPRADQEFNWGCGRHWFDPTGCEGSASYAVMNMPSNVEQIFSETGGEFGTGGGDLLDCADTRNPCRQAYWRTLTAWNQDPYKGRASWDPLVTLAAVRGVENVHGRKLGAGGHNVVDPNGTNVWYDGDDAESRQSYMALKGDIFYKDLEERQKESQQGARGRVPGGLPSTTIDLKEEIDRLLCIPPRTANP